MQDVNINGVFGYRWLDLDCTSGTNETLFKNDVLTQGPVPGFGFRC